MPRNFRQWLPYILLGVVLLVSLMFANFGERPAAGIDVPYSEFKNLLDKGEVEAVTFQGEKAVVALKRPLPIGPAGTETRLVETRIPAFGDPELLSGLEAGGVVVTNEAKQEANWLTNLLPWIIFIGIYLWVMNRMYRNMSGRLGGRNPTDFLAGSAKREEKAGRRVTFADVAGQDNAKAEVAELVDLLNHPERYNRLGAEPPHGVLLVGPPGTGKTLLARALAGEAEVPFFHISASEFIEMFVGVGASRVRKMFDEAKKRAPSIIFIDELDAVGRMRGSGLGGGNDEREQTLNQILSEMDGFAGHDAVIVLAATNRPDVLDPALLRPGRFDRHVTLELPDKDARRAILDVHTAKAPLAPDVDLEVVAASTPGFSGADLKNLVNEAAMAAARADAEQIAMADFDQMRDKIMMGTVRNLAIQPDERHRLAVHEAGHTVAAHYLVNADPLYKVTPPGMSLNSDETHLLPEEERHTLPEAYLKDRLAVMLGGRAAEKILLDNVSSGADDDIQQATQLARAMVARWGMSEEIGAIDLRQSDEHPFLGREIAQPRRFSEATAHQVDQAVRHLLAEAEERAAGVIAEHRARMEQLIGRLEMHETLDHDQIDACLGVVERRGRNGRPGEQASAAGAG